MVLNIFSNCIPLALIIAAKQNTLKARQWKASFGLLFYKQVSSVIGGYISKNRRSAAPSVTASASSLPTVNPSGRMTGLPPSEAGH